MPAATLGAMPPKNTEQHSETIYAYSNISFDGYALIEVLKNKETVFCFSKPSLNSYIVLSFSHLISCKGIARWHYRGTISIENTNMPTD